ncbi:MAG: hypothetical protein RJQ09_04655 [Cyclobacteriaceae bacterium]
MIAQSSIEYLGTRGYQVNDYESFFELRPTRKSNILLQVVLFSIGISLILFSATVIPMYWEILLLIIPLIGYPIIQVWQSRDEFSFLSFDQLNKVVVIARSWPFATIRIFYDKIEDIETSEHEFYNEPNPFTDRAIQKFKNVYIVTEGRKFKILTLEITPETTHDFNQLVEEFSDIFKDSKINVA